MATIQTAPTAPPPPYYRELVPIVLPDDYVCPNPEKRDEMMQTPVIDKSGYFVARHFAGRSDVMVRTGGFVFYNEYRMNYRFRPDLYVAFGVDRDDIRRRNGYVVWKMGKPPDFVLEVASETTSEWDTGGKPGLYSGIGIPEYWRVDPTGGEFYGYPIAGDLLVNGVYHPMPLATEPDGTIWGYSPALDLCLCWNSAWDWDVDDESGLRFYDRKTGRYLCDFTLVEAARDDAIAELARAQERIRQLESDLGQRPPSSGNARP